jgi:hypothetical protein
MICLQITGSDEYVHDGSVVLGGKQSALSRFTSCLPQQAVYASHSLGFNLHIKLIKNIWELSFEPFSTTTY